MDLSIVIVSYNSRNFLEGCLNSIITSEDSLKKEIIVVDNASTDGSVSWLKSNFPGVLVIPNSSNVGFSRANNQGAKISKGNYVLFLNPDTIVEKNTLGEMVDFIRKRPDIGVIGPKLVYPDGALQYSCRYFYNVRTILLRRTILGKIFPDSALLKQHLMSNWGHNEIREVDWVIAASLLTSKKILEQVGYFDEGYKMYFEDVDLCYRIKLAGYKVYYYPEGRVIHYYQRESARKFDRKAFWHIQSAIRFFSKFGWKF